MISPDSDLSHAYHEFTHEVSKATSQAIESLKGALKGVGREALSHSVDVEKRETHVIFHAKKLARATLGAFGRKVNEIWGHAFGKEGKMKPEEPPEEVPPRKDWVSLAQGVCKGVLLESLSRKLAGEEKHKFGNILIALVQKGILTVEDFNDPKNAAAAKAIAAQLTPEDRIRFREALIEGTASALSKKILELQAKKRTFNEATTPEEKKAMDESLFQCSKELYRARQAASSLDKNHPARRFLSELEYQFEQENPHFPRARDIVKALGEDALKGTLEETVGEIIKDLRIDPAEVKQDCQLFNCTPDEVLYRVAKRLVRSERTGFHLSTVSAIDRKWQEVKGTNREGFTEFYEEKGGDKTIKRAVVFLPKEGSVYVKEKFLHAGSYKAAFAASSFFQVKKVEKRGEDAILQVATSVWEEIPHYEEEEAEAGGSGTFVPNYEAEADNALAEALEVAKAQRREEILGERVEASEAELAYQREVCLCKVAGRLEGVWPTHTVTTIDGKTALIQKKAGYVLDESSVADDMGSMQARFNTLTPEQQRTYLDMMKGVLRGVQSLHGAGIIHRDLKFPNVLCAPEGQAGVSDLGEACFLSDAESMRQFKGTPVSTSPEVSALYNPTSEPTVAVGVAADIWSLGFMLWQSCGKKVEECPPCRIMSQVAVEGELEGAERVIAQMALLTHEDEKKRYLEAYPEPSAKGSLEHLAWACMRADPAQRPTLQEIIDIYGAWSAFAKRELAEGRVASIQECFQQAPEAVQSPL